MFLVVASVVGSGIFLTPGAIADRLPHPGLIFAVWIAGGLLSLAGALANAELGAMFPHAGGDYVYLREAFHPAAGFVVGWLSFFAIYAGTVATLAAGFAESVAPLLGLPAAAVVPLAIATVVASSALNYASVRWSALANNATGWLKVVALLAFALRGPLHRRGRRREPASARRRHRRRRGRRGPSRSRSRRCCSATSAGTPRSSSRARSATRSATCRARSSSASGSARRSTCW